MEGPTKKRLLRIVAAFDSDKVEIMGKKYNLEKAEKDLQVFSSVEKIELTTDVSQLTVTFHSKPGYFFRGTQKEVHLELHTIDHSEVFGFAFHFEKFSPYEQLSQINEYLQTLIMTTNDLSSTTSSYLYLFALEALFKQFHSDRQQTYRFKEHETRAIRQSLLEFDTKNHIVFVSCLVWNCMNHENSQIFCNQNKLFCSDYLEALAEDKFLIDEGLIIKDF